MDSGTTRFCICIGKYAFKFPKFSISYPNGHRWKIFLRGILANIDENYWWKYSQNKEKLCDVLFYFPLGLFIVMKRAKPLSDTEYEYEKMKKDFCEFSLDNKKENFGKLDDDRIVLIDYADSKYMCSDCSFNYKNR